MFQLLIMDPVFFMIYRVDDYFCFLDYVGCIYTRVVSVVSVLYHRYTCE